MKGHEPAASVSDQFGFWVEESNQIISRFQQDYVGFPLTPALSLGARESRIQFLGGPERFDHADGLETILPLPKGEGRGEGENYCRVEEGAEFQIRLARVLNSERGSVLLQIRRAAAFG